MIQPIISILNDFPEEYVKTITFDGGKEFAGYKTIEKELKHICVNHTAQGKKRTNENSNSLLREFYPKGMDLQLVDETKLAYYLSLMNNRPRKCLDYKTHSEVIFINLFFYFILH